MSIKKDGYQLCGGVMEKMEYEIIKDLVKELIEKAETQGLYLTTSRVSQTTGGISCEINFRRNEK